jgi:hypothetical protein
MRGIAFGIGMLLLLPCAALAQRSAAQPTAAQSGLGKIPPGPVGDRAVTVINHAPHGAVELYISPQAADVWGGDQLGENMLDAGAQRLFALGRAPDCGFDFLIVYDDLSREEQRGVDICKIKQVIFDGRHASLPPDALGPARRVTVVDKTSMPLQQLYISSPDAAQWGDDLLSSGAMSVDEQRAIAYRGPCSVDIRVVFANRAAEERRGVNLCAMTTLRIAPGWTTMDLPAGAP